MRILSRLAFAVLTFAPLRASLPFGVGAKDTDDGSTVAKDGDIIVLKKDDEATSSVRGAASKVRSAGESEDAASASAAALTSIASVVEDFFREAPSSSSSPLVETKDALSEVVKSSAASADVAEFLRSVRRSLHEHPELMYELPFTSRVIQDVLDELGVRHTSGWAVNTHEDVFEGPGGHGVVAEIGDGREPCVVLRADMDALPIVERTKVDFRSRETGKMHACGHDGHTTMLLGAAALLKRAESSIRGTVRLVFQPAEEGGAGMKRMVEEGLVEKKPKVRYAFGMHVWPTLPSGTVATIPGPIMAAAEQFTIEIHGKGGHAAMPHLTIDPIVASASLISSLQSIVSRNVSPLEAGVVSVTALRAGEAFNVIPETAVLKGTVRSLTEKGLLDLRDRVGAMADAIATSHGCNATIVYSPDYYQPVVNDPALFEWSSTVGALVSVEGKTRDDVPPTMGGEDFAFLANAVPSTFFWLGQGTGERHGDERHRVPRTDYGLHHPAFALDEEVLHTGVELHVNLALRALRKALTEDANERRGRDTNEEEEL